MSDFFSAFVGGVKGIVDVASANISPYKVQSVKLEDYKRFQLKCQDGHMILYKRHGCFECLLTNPVLNKTFSIFRLTSENDAVGQFKKYSYKVNILIDSSSSAYQEPVMQNISDAIREHPTWTPGHMAAYLGLFECFNHPQVASQLNNNSTMFGKTPLMIAIFGKQLQCVKCLLNLGATMHVQDNKGDNVYHYATRFCPDVIPILAEYDHHGVVNWVNNEGFTALGEACTKASAEDIEKLLMAKANPEISNGYVLPIHAAVKRSEMRAVELIAQRVPDQLSAVDGKYGGTALHWARSKEAVRGLHKLGCDLNIQSKTGYTPLHVMMKKKRLHCVIELLIHGADTTLQDCDGNTPLHLAVLEDDQNLVKLFVVYGADVNVKNSKNQSPRHLAATSNGKNKEFIINMLHIAGAKRCDADVKGCLGACFAEGTLNGKQEPELEKVLENDSVALFDEMIGSLVDLEQNADGTNKPRSGDRVLSLDGGGIRGLVLVQLLLAIEKEVGKPIRECFDWIGGTSTGGMLALGIAVGKPLSYLRGMYLRLKNEVFKGQRPYPQEPLEELLKKELGENLVMTDIKHPRVIVTSVLGDRHPPELHMFRNYEPTLKREERRNSNGSPKSTKPKHQYTVPPPPHEQPVWLAGRCSGAAPTYFKSAGVFLDGGLNSNNPTLDILTEIHEYNCGLRLRNEGHLTRRVGVVVSLGTGRIPVTPVSAVDIYRPEGITDLTKVAKGIQNLINILLEQATVSEGRPVDRARSWCGMLDIPYFRLSPQLLEEISLDEKDDKQITEMLWQTQCYIVANKDRIKKLAELLRQD